MGSDGVNAHVPIRGCVIHIAYLMTPRRNHHERTTLTTGDVTIRWRQRRNPRRSILHLARQRARQSRAQGHHREQASVRTARRRPTKLVDCVSRFLLVRLVLASLVGDEFVGERLVSGDRHAVGKVVGELQWETRCCERELWRILQMNMNMGLDGGA